MDTRPDLLDQIVVELAAMTRYALGAGLPVDADVVALLASRGADAPARGADAPARDVGELVAAHRVMAARVAPATPAALVLLHPDGSTAGRWGFLGPVHLVRRLLATAVGFLVLFVATSTSGYVNHESGDLFTGSGVSVLIPELFLMGAAGMGAAFAALFRVERYIAARTYDPTYESAYWTHVVLGVIAGVLLAELIPVEGDVDANRPLLALLGGFSASVVHRVLVRLVEALESLVAPPDHSSRRALAPGTTSGVRDG